MNCLAGCFNTGFDKVQDGALITRKIVLMGAGRHMANIIGSRLLLLHL